MRRLKPILYAGALVGVLDITAACIQVYIAYGYAPARLLKGVAGGLLGRSAVEGGFSTAALGLVDAFYDGADCGSDFLRAKPTASVTAKAFGSRGCGTALWSGGFCSQ